MRGSKRHGKRALVSLVILNYNGKADTLEFLKSIKKTDYPNYEIIVVDNASTDGSVETIRKKFPKVGIVENKKNLGFAGGMNSGIKKAKGEYLVIMDNDRVIKNKNWLTLLVDTAESDNKIGIVVPLLLYYKTDIIQTVGQVAPNILTKITSCTYLLGKNEMDVDQYNETIEIAAGNGLIKKVVLEKIGTFDEKMFCYFEETDLCFRAMKAGYKIVSQPKSKMWHKGSATIQSKSYFSVYHNYKNKIRFIIKNYDTLTKIVALGFNSIYYTYLILTYTLNNKPEPTKAIIDGIIWNFQNWRDYI